MVGTADPSCNLLVVLRIRVTHETLDTPDAIDKSDNPNTFAALDTPYRALERNLAPDAERIID